MHFAVWRYWLHFSSAIYSRCITARGHDLRAFQNAEHREPAQEASSTVKAETHVRKLQWAIEDEIESHYFERALKEEDEDDAV